MSTKSFEPALYTGTTGHYRLSPKAHEFHKPVRMVHVDVDRLASLNDLPLWSDRRGHPMVVDVTDHLDGSDRPLGPRLRDLAEQRLGWRPEHRITMLTQPRTWGYVFNPLTIYYCWDAEDENVIALIMEVTNTPWKERHHYVVDARDAQTRSTQKELHVSPFMPMNQSYQFTWRDPGERLLFSITILQDGERIFTADMDLTAQPLTRRSARRAAFARPWSTLAVTTGIHVEAVKLWVKGVSFHPHPKKLAGKSGEDHSEAAHQLISSGGPTDNAMKDPRGPDHDSRRQLERTPR